MSGFLHFPKGCFRCQKLLAVADSEVGFGPAAGCRPVPNCQNSLVTCSSCWLTRLPTKIRQIDRLMTAGTAVAPGLAVQSRLGQAGSDSDSGSDFDFGSDPESALTLQTGTAGFASTKCQNL